MAASTAESLKFDIEVAPEDISKEVFCFLNSGVELEDGSVAQRYVDASKWLLPLSTIVTVLFF